MTYLPERLGQRPRERSSLLQTIPEMEDIAAVKEELAEKRQALEALQRNFDDFQESSRELEDELEAELGRVSAAAVEQCAGDTPDVSESPLRGVTCAFSRPGLHFLCHGTALAC